MLTYSRYNHLVKTPEEAGACALVNFRTGAVMRLTSFQEALFMRATELPETTNFVQKLREAGCLVAYDELRHMRTQALSANSTPQILKLTVCPTLACNFACPYCFETHRSGRMSQETAAQVVKFAKDNMKLFGLKRLDVTWFGGEPLLAPDIVERLSRQFIDLCDELSAEYQAGIITNGWFLTEENFRLLERSKVNRIQITLDGPTPETNDHLRREKGGGSSFKRIMENIKKLYPYAVASNSLRVTIRCNVNRDNVSSFEELKGKIEAMSAQTGVDMVAHASRMDIDKPAKSLEIAQKEMAMAEYAASQTPEDLLKRWGPPFYRRIYCMAQSVCSFAIDELGNLYKCWEAIGKDDLAFGNVKNFRYAGEPDENIGAMDAYYETLFPEYDKECMECKFFPLCLGGCPHRRVMNRRECIAWRDNPDGYALTRYREWKKQKGGEK